MERKYDPILFLFQKGKQKWKLEDKNLVHACFCSLQAGSDTKPRHILDETLECIFHGGSEWDHYTFKNENSVESC